MLHGSCPGGHRCGRRQRGRRGPADARVEQQRLDHLAGQPLDLLSRKLGGVAADLVQRGLLPRLLALVAAAPEAPEPRARLLLRLLQLLRNVRDLPRGELLVGDERGGRQRGHPVLVPQQVQHVRVGGGLEEGDVQAVVLLGVHPKVLDLGQGDGLVLGGALVGRPVSLGVRPERADLHLAAGHGAHRVHHHRQEGLLVLLVHHLRGAVDAGQPAAVAGVRVVPPHHVLRPRHTLVSVHKVNHVLVRLRLRVDARFCALHWQRKAVHHNECVLHHLALQHAHHL
mmetsp:Transcript_20368/g.51608  ORF Transcript_20368/g.51608 Transcript_20368/m.51608 type:complete len:284 (+) Transcript_20368:361-1212(+)